MWNDRGVRHADTTSSGSARIRPLGVVSELQAYAYPELNDIHVVTRVKLVTHAETHRREADGEI